MASSVTALGRLPRTVRGVGVAETEGAEIGGDVEIVENTVDGGVLGVRDAGSGEYGWRLQSSVSPESAETKTSFRRSLET